VDDNKVDRMIWTGLMWPSIEDSEHHDEPPGYIKYLDIFEYLSYWWLVKKDSALFS
jgi:hypothetical protein